MNPERVGHEVEHRRPRIADEGAARRLAELTGHGARGLEDGRLPALYIASLGTDLLSALLMDPGLELDLLRVHPGPWTVSPRAPVKAGDELIFRARVAEVSDGPLGEVALLAATATRGAEVVLELSLACLIKGPGRKRRRGDGAPSPGDPFDAAAPGEAKTISVTAGLGRSLAASTGEPNAAYLDDEGARTADLPGGVLPPLATLALVWGAAEQTAAAAAEVRSFSGWASRLVRWGDELRIEARETPTGWVARAQQQDGIVVVKDVLLESRA